MKATPGRTIGINTTRKDIEGAVRLTKDTNMPQLVSGNHVIIYVDTALPEHTIWKAITNMVVHNAESVVFRGEDWIQQLRMEDIT